MTKPIICTLSAEELAGYAAALEEAAAEIAALDAAAPERAAPMFKRWAEDRAAIARALIANAEAEETEAVELEEAAQEGLADAVAAAEAPRARKAPPSRPMGRPMLPGDTPVRTPEREALLRQLYPAGERREKILAALNALPGDPIASSDAVRQWAVSLGLKREAVSPETLAVRRAAIATANTARLGAPLLPAEEQEQLRGRLRDQLHAEGLTIAAGAQRVGVSATNLYPWLSGKSLSTVAVQVRDWLDRRAAAPAIAPAAPEDPDPHLDAGDEAAARQMLAIGNGARELAKHFGGKVEWWQDWCAAERAKARSAA